MESIKKIVVFLVVLFCIGCNTEQRKHENALLFPKEEKYGFEVTYNSSYYSDVTACFNFSTMPSDETILAIESELTKFEDYNHKKLIHETEKADGRYSVVVHFKRKEYGTYLEHDLESGIAVFNVLLKSIDDNPNIQNLLAVHFE